MRIDKIVLNNFGSYEGETVFDTSTENGRNIILVGGKNGAGKTTLFTAMRVCLYGYMSMGYKNYNAFYTRAISKQINNTAKLTKPTNASVSMQIMLSNGRDLDIYELTRSWVLDESLSETFLIAKNGVLLGAEEVADFEKYLLSLIPPELFNLYFFDGEKIADFFMNEGSNTRIKEAFLTLCGYDTFDIMRRNFKRISGGSASSSAALEEYLQAKQSAAIEDAKYQDAIAKLKQLSGVETMQGLLNYCDGLREDGVELPIRIDQASLSNGEKQIFIMALYHSLVQLGRHEIPFIIDTPFARIDTEHRHNISKYFFSKLKGQVFILSTNEEINSDHVQILRNHIAATYLLENTDNKKTVVVNDTYFEV